MVAFYWFLTLIVQLGPKLQSSARVLAQSGTLKDLITHLQAVLIDGQPFEVLQYLGAINTDTKRG